VNRISLIFISFGIFLAFSTFSYARNYDPQNGRFLEEDPEWNANLYIYADNNPILFVDPYGLTVEHIGEDPEYTISLVETLKEEDMFFASEFSFLDEAEEIYYVKSVISPTDPGYPIASYDWEKREIELDINLSFSDRSELGLINLGFFSKTRNVNLISLRHEFGHAWQHYTTTHYGTRWDPVPAQYDAILRENFLRENLGMPLHPYPKIDFYSD